MKSGTLRMLIPHRNMEEFYSSYEEDGGGVGGGERETVGLVAGPPPLRVFLNIAFIETFQAQR